MGKILGFGKGQQGNTLRLNYKNFLAEIGLQNGKFVFMVNSEVVHNLGAMQTEIDTLKAEVVNLTDRVVALEGV
jgi:sulfur carrier protein ThiS